MGPEIRFAKCDGIAVAYQTFGDGPDLVICPGWVTNVEYGWELPERARFHEELARFARVTIFDKRGTGLSDRNVGAAILEERMDDLRAVMDASSIRAAHVLGVSEGGSMAMLFAATFPERVQSLLLFGSFACRSPQSDYPWAPTPERRQVFFDAIEQHWHDSMDIGTIAPSLDRDPVARRRLATYFRMSASPQGALALARLNTEIDVRHVLPAIRVPTVVMHRERDADANVEEARYIASKIPGARAWRERLQGHHAAVERHVRIHRGRLVKLVGDGALALFDGPGRAVRCAQTIVADPGAADVTVRAGLHTGEVEVMGDDVGGIAMHVAARVVGEAAGGEVLTTSTVRELCAGSGLTFSDRGLRELAGLPEPWRVFGVA